MNYSHTYHAGCFADVLKHWVQTLCLQRMLQKAAPMAIIDTHAGYGLYDLQSEDAKATETFRSGIARLFQPMLGDRGQQLWLPRTDMPPSFHDYMALVRQVNHPNSLRYYPGSAEISRLLRRSMDNIHLLDAHIDAYQALCKRYRNTTHIHMHHANAYQHVLGLLPPRERRGFIIIDPPFESTKEFELLVGLIAAALARFAHGSYLIWYPIKRVAEVLAFKTAIRALSDKPMLCIEGWLCKRLPPQGLAATGVLLINPPFGVEAQIVRDLPWLMTRFSDDPTAQALVQPL